MKQTFAMFILVLAVFAPPAAAASDLASQEIAAQIIAQGGAVELDDQGRIVGVFLGGTWATDADLEPIASLRYLRKLDLSLTYVSNRGMEILKGLEQLEELNLFAAEFITDTGLSFLRGHSNLKKLNLRGTDITDTGLKYVAQFSALRSLDISFTLISEVGLESLSSLTHLEELIMGANEIKGVGLHALKLLPKLRTLSLKGLQMRNGSRCWAVEVGEPELEAIASLTKLQNLNLGWGLGSANLRPDRAEGVVSGTGSRCNVRDGGIKLTDSGLKKLATLINLQSLELSGSKITSASLAEVLPSWKNLRQLSLWNVKDVDDTMIGALVRLEHLKTLDLSRTGITDEGLRELANHSSLRRLYLSRTNVTATGVETFRESNPRCWLSWNGNAAAGKTEEIAVF